MRKIYSLLAMCLVAMMANAQVLVNYEHTADLPAGITNGGTTVMASVAIHTNADKVNCIQLKNGYTSNSALNGNAIEVATEGGFKAGDVVEIAGFINIKEDEVASKSGKFVIYVLDSSDSGYDVLWTSEDLINGRLSADEPRVDTYTLEQDCEKFYIARSGNTGTNLYSLKVTRAEAPAGPSIMVGKTAYEIVATETASVTMFANTAYQGISASFATQLANMLAAVGLESATTDQLVQVDNAGVGFAYNMNDGWHGADGAIEGKTWGSEDKLICVKPWGATADGDVIDGTINYLGCIDTNWNVGETHICKFAVINNGKAAVLELTIEFKPVPLEEPTTSYAALNVVKEYEMVLEYTLGGQYEGRTDSLAVEGIYEALGCSAEDLATSSDKVFMARIMGTDESSSNVWTDELKVSRFDTDGWFGRYSSYNEATGEETPIVQNAPHGWGSGCTFYLQNAKIADGVFTVTNGQYPGTMKVGDADFAEIFVCNGTKAVKITVKAVVKEPEVDPDQPGDEPGDEPAENVPFDQMTKVGEQNLVAVGKPGDYATTETKFDLNAVIEALGCQSPQEISEWVYENAGSIIDPKTNNDYWQSEEGYSQAWGADACAKVYPSEFNIQTGKFTVMQMAGEYGAITEAVGPFPIKYLFVKGDKYYQINIAYTIDPNVEEQEMTIVGEDYITMQMLPLADAYLYGTTTQLDYEYFSQLLGTTSFRLYGEKYNASTGVYLDNATNCSDGDAKGAGFWYRNPTHENMYGETVVTADGWGDNSFGFQLSSSGVISWFQVPGARSVGDQFFANIYFVNEDNNTAVKVKLNVMIVDEIRPEAETIGEEKVLVEAKEATADGTYKVVLDMSKAYEALGISADEIEAAQIVAPKSKNTFAYFEPEEDIIYDANGYVTSNEEAIVAMANLAIEDGTPILTIDPMDIDLTSEEATSVTVRVGLEYNGKRYIHVVTLGNATYTAINGVKSTSNAAAIYTINGVKVNALQKGLNIMKMTDGTVKKVLVK